MNLRLGLVIGNGLEKIRHLLTEEGGSYDTEPKMLQLANRCNCVYKTCYLFLVLLLYVKTSQQQENENFF